MSGTFAGQLEKALPAVRRYARVLTRDPSRADDLVQDVALRAWERRGQFREMQHGNLRSWLLRITHNEWVNGVRRDNRAKEYAKGWPAAAEAVSGRQMATIELRETEAALRQLPRDQREAIVLFAVAGETGEDIAAALGVPLGTVRTRIMRGREKLHTLTTGETKHKREANLRAPAPSDQPPKRDHGRIAEWLEQEIKDALRVRSRAQVAKQFAGACGTTTVYKIAKGERRPAQPPVFAGPRQAAPQAAF